MIDSREHVPESRRVLFGFYQIVYHQFSGVADFPVSSTCEFFFVDSVKHIALPSEEI